MLAAAARGVKAFGLRRQGVRRSIERIACDTVARSRVIMPSQRAAARSLAAARRLAYGFEIKYKIRLCKADMILVPPPADYLKTYHAGS